MKRPFLILFIILLQLSYSQVDSTKNSYSNVPDDVTTYIKDNFPNFKFPETSWYTHPYIDSTSKFYELYKKNEDIPPYYAFGDFNGDGLIDYILHIGKGVVGEDIGPSYTYKYVLLHGSEKGYKAFPFLFNKTYGGYLRYIKQFLMAISPEELTSTFPNIANKNLIKHTLFVFASHMRVDCFFWDGEKYNMINLYAD